MVQQWPNTRCWNILGNYWHVCPNPFRDKDYLQPYSSANVCLTNCEFLVDRDNSISHHEKRIEESIYKELKLNCDKIKKKSFSFFLEVIICFYQPAVSKNVYFKKLDSFVTRGVYRKPLSPEKNQFDVFLTKTLPWRIDKSNIVLCAWFACFVWVGSSSKLRQHENFMTREIWKSNKRSVSWFSTETDVSWKRAFVVFERSPCAHVCH